MQNDADRAIELAAELLRIASALQTPHERRQQAELDRLIGHEAIQTEFIAVFKLRQSEGVGY